MNLFRLSVNALIVFCIAGISHADDSSTGKMFHHELGFGINPLLGFAGNTSGGDLYTDFSGSLAISVSASYKYAVLRHLQVGTVSSLSYLKASSSSTTLLQVLAGPTLNIPFSSDWLVNSLYISTYGGFVVADTNASSSHTYGALEGTIGYRLGLLDHFSWSPSIGAYKILDGSKFLFFVRPIAFSILF